MQQLVRNQQFVFRIGDLAVMDHFISFLVFAAVAVQCAQSLTRDEIQAFTSQVQVCIHPMIYM